jgi:hypothetical protein
MRRWIINTKRKCSLIIATVFVLASTGAGQETKSFLSVQDILSGWQSNYGELKSMKVSYSEEIVSAEPSQRDPNITHRLAKWHYVERVEEGRKFRARTSITEKGFADINSIEESSFDGVHQRVYRPGLKQGLILVKGDKKGIPSNLLKSYLLLEPFSTSLPSKDNEEPEFSRMISNGLTDPNLTISVRPVLEQISGQMCHVLEIVRKDKTEEKAAIIWVAHEKGMLPMKVQEFGGGTMPRERTVEQVDFAKTENGGLWFPKKASQVLNLPQSLGIIKYEFNVLEFVPDIKTDPNTFQLDFPNGTQVGDTELGLNYTVGVK